jgi:hypothetical protein
MRRLSLHGHHWLALAIMLVVVVAAAAALAHPWETNPIDSYAACMADGNPVTETYPPVCHDGARAFRGPGTVQPPVQSPLASQDFTLLVEGDSRGAYPRREEVITTQAGWQRYWREVHASLASQPPLLPVDFAASVVVAISEGKQMTSGYNLTITGITTSQTGSTVAYTESIPTIGCTVAQTASNRYLIIRTPKLPEPVIFRKTAVKRQC